MLTFAVPSAITKKPMPPLPSWVTVSPALKVRSFIDCDDLFQLAVAEAGEERDALDQFNRCVSHGAEHRASWMRRYEA